MNYSMTATDIFCALQAQFGEQDVELVDTHALQPRIRIIAPDKLIPVCTWLRDTAPFRFDMLACLSGIDDGTEKGIIRIVYHLQSILEGHSLSLELITERNTPVCPSVSGIWRAADWHEREAYDMLGIVFSGHPDLRRILLANDWEGFPLRKDYTPAESYHGIRIAYVRPDGR